MSAIHLTAEERTVVFSDKQAYAIQDMIDTCHAEDITESLDVIVQQLLNNCENLRSDIGNSYFSIKLLVKMYATIEPALKPIQARYRELQLKK